MYAYVYMYMYAPCFPVELALQSWSDSEEPSGLKPSGLSVYSSAMIKHAARKLRKIDYGIYIYIYYSKHTTAITIYGIHYVISWIFTCVYIYMHIYT